MRLLSLASTPTVCLQTPAQMGYQMIPTLPLLEVNPKVIRIHHESVKRKPIIPLTGRLPQRLSVFIRLPDGVVGSTGPQMYEIMGRAGTGAILEVRR
ncbi:hypothetical protein NDU88_005262 [Pleurodeles waltl]|uniref:Uncharacterized protein n=1 Tax=Pleurodeles waltl TaxID=8319 RepID=A0AAV7RIJ6_PLEWA|nr:hypothetical protein NDU88_005262 [Pleurodeles waltl]